MALIDCFHSLHFLVGCFCQSLFIVAAVYLDYGVPKADHEPDLEAQALQQP